MYYFLFVFQLVCSVAVWFRTDLPIQAWNVLLFVSYSFPPILFLAAVITAIGVRNADDKSLLDKIINWPKQRVAGFVSRVAWASWVLGLASNGLFVLAAWLLSLIVLSTLITLSLKPAAEERLEVLSNE